MDHTEEPATEVSEEQTPPFKHYFFKLCYAEMIAVACVLIGVAAVKFLAPKTFVELKAWYTDRFCVETTVQSVLDAHDSLSGSDGIPLPQGMG